MQQPLFQSPLKPQITFSPIGVTEYPFFCLSRNPAHSKLNIEFSGIDAKERPFSWKVKPNSDGLPGEAAWEIWQTLIQPLLHSHQPLKHGLLIPLGGVRNCLRTMGWTISGANAKVLMKALSQITGATIEVDLWLPLLHPGPEGETFRCVRSRGPRILFYSIGEYLVTENELRAGGLVYAYDLNDVISIRIAIEADLQQNIQYRPLDLEYVRSVSPSARRWYELTLGHVFGTVSHPASRGYFDIRYSWYVSRHHTLELQVDLRRIKMQIEKVIKDHLKSAYLAKVEYLQEKKGRDIVIRCYPGPTARRSISRVKSLLAGRKGLIAIEDDPKETPIATLETNHHFEELIKTLGNEFGVIERIAKQLVEQGAVKVERQIEAFPYRKAKPENLAAFIVQAIKEDWPLPEKYLENLARLDREREEAQRQAETQELHNRYNALYNEYLDDRLSAIQKSASERWNKFIEDTTTRQQSILQGFNPEMMNIAKDWSEMVRYNALTFFGFDQQDRIYFIDEWIEWHEGKSIATAK